MLLIISLNVKKVELPCKMLEQMAFNTGPKIEEHILIVMDKSIHKENLAQPSKTINKQNKYPVTFLTGYNGVLHITERNNELYFAKSFTDKDSFILVTNPQVLTKLKV